MILALVVTIRFVCERMGARSSYLACVDVKRILREKIYDKMLKLGASYSEQVSSSEVVQVSTEGVEQLETYFGKYLPQLFLQPDGTVDIISHSLQSECKGKCDLVDLCATDPDLNRSGTEDRKEIIK